MHEYTNNTAHTTASSSGYPFISYPVESMQLLPWSNELSAVLEISILYSSVNLPVVLDQHNATTLIWMAFQSSYWLYVFM
jgi:hypothetical protein